MCKAIHVSYEGHKLGHVRWEPFFRSDKTKRNHVFSIN